MKNLLLALVLSIFSFPIISFAQKLQTDTIVFTEIVEDIGYPHLTYIDSRGAEHMDLIFKDHVILISGWVLFNNEIDYGITQELNENIINQVIGKKVERVYHVENHQNHKSLIVHKLTLLEDEISSDGLRFAKTSYDWEVWLCAYSKAEAKLNFNNDLITGTFMNESKNQTWEVGGQFMEIDNLPFIFISLKVSKNETHTFIGIERTTPSEDEDYDATYSLSLYRIYGENSETIKEKVIRLKTIEEKPDYVLYSCAG